VAQKKTAMIVNSMAIDGLLLIEPTVYIDDRGEFFEPFNAARFKKETQLNIKFVQDNESISKAGVLRGMHFQIPPFEQGKLVRVSRGKALDVAVDLRADSPTFGMHLAVLLSAENHLQFFIPPGFAHGFLALENDTVFSYKCTAHYAAEAERSIVWNDPQLGIDWGIDNPVLSAKDAAAPIFSAFDSPFLIEHSGR
jgi:dTDP-4-dehydrorhamnose 3,5-epimerase